jgi:hypothetical protein
VADVPGIVVETNWIVDVALRQDEPSAELFACARDKRVHLYLPVFCIAEATKNVETKQADIRRVLSQEMLPKLGRELSPR